MTPAQRQEVANTCAVGLQLSIPILLDTADNQADIAFSAWPERLYVLSPAGQIVYKGGKGPYKFDVEEMKAFLTGYLHY